MASGLPREVVSKVFNFVTSSSAMERALNKDLPRYLPLYGMQGIHMSPRHLVLSRRDDNFDNEKANVDNFLEGVRYIHQYVEMNKVYNMYELGKVAALNKTIMSIVNEIHDLSGTQLQLIYGLNASQLWLLTETSLQDLQDIGVKVDGSTIEVLIKIVLRLGMSGFITAQL